MELSDGTEIGLVPAFIKAEDIGKEGAEVVWPYKFRGYKMLCLCGGTCRRFILS